MKLPATLLMLFAGQVAGTNPMLAAESLPRTRIAVTPVFGQLVAFSLPPGFVPAFEKTTGNTYIREAVLAGESVDQWSQMITLSGAQDRALNPAMSPAQYLREIAERFVEACPGTFANKVLGTVTVDGHDAFVGLLGCGTIRSGTPRSEVVMIIAIKGKSDMYTIQWAERSDPVGRSPALDEEKWSSRIPQLDPVRICNPVAREKAPYPSCIGPASGT